MSLRNVLFLIFSWQSTGNNIYKASGLVGCNDGTNTFKSPVGNFPSSLCVPSTSNQPSVSNEPSLSPTVDCDVNTFAELQGAIDGDGDIKLCRGTIAFTEQIYLNNKQLTFTCPNGGCVLDAESRNRFFSIDWGNISFDGITFKNGSAGVSPQ